jgi:hypothetical protein
MKTKNFSMKNNHYHKTKKYPELNGRIRSRDPEHQNFDNLDAFNDFTNIRIINKYRKIGEEIMGRNFWK